MSDYKAANIQVLKDTEKMFFNEKPNFNIIVNGFVKNNNNLTIETLHSALFNKRKYHRYMNKKRTRKVISDLSESRAAILHGLKTDREIKIFSEKYGDLNKIPARKLRALILKWNKSLEKNPKHLLTKKEQDLILGTVIGDGNIRQREKYSCLRFGHSKKQKKYYEHKTQIMNKFRISENRETKRKIKNHYIEGYDFATRTHPVFNYYRKLFYNNEEKEITSKILNKLNSRSLAYWICDDGSYCISGENMILCTNSFSKEEHILMKEYFNKKWKLDPTIGFRDKKYYYLRFKKEDTKKLIKIIKPYIPKSMRYKIGGKND